MKLPSDIPRRAKDNEVDKKPPELFGLDLLLGVNPAPVVNPISGEQHTSLVNRIPRFQSTIHCHQRQPTADFTLNDIWRMPERRAGRNDFLFDTQLCSSSSLYGRFANPLEAIKPEAVLQGDIDDCYFLSSVAAVACGNPDVIRNMVAENADGSYTVTFPGARDKPVRVDRASIRSADRSTRTSEHGIWPLVLEAAFGKYLSENPREEERILGRQTSVRRLPSFVEYTGGGGRASLVLQLLTGNQVSGIEMHQRRDVELAREALRSAFSANLSQALVATISNDNQSALAAGLTPRHAYAVVGFDPTNDIVILRDPYGRAKPNQDGKCIETNRGVFRMPVSEFVRNFDELAIGMPGQRQAPGLMLRRFR